MPTGFSDKSISTTVCIRRLTTVLLRECVLYNKSSGNGVCRNLACCVFNTEETFVRIVMSNMGPAPLSLWVTLTWLKGSLAILLAPSLQAK